ncbi:MAG: LamG-like jellyroll fold domain-containing protein, partial [Planctomycetota bacterium]|nr:LamG-like jellyroll fold domain-containing protein [Planctomycetota bacterium]
MSRKLVLLISFLLVLGMTAVSSAGLDDDANLVGWWKFDGDTSDSSGNGRDGSLMADAHLVDVGLHGGALSLDGSGDYVNINGYKGVGAVDEVQHPFTVANWFRTTSGEGEMVTWGSGPGRQRLTWRINGGRLRTEHGSGNLRGNTYVNDGEWHHGALVVTEGANLRVPNTLLYLDGAEDSTFSGSNNTYNLGNSTDVSIGRRATSNDRWFNGAIDDVRIYDRVLDANEVAELAIRPKSYAANPGVGALIEEASIMLGWMPGGRAVSHDLYFGTTADLGPDQLVGQQQTDTQYLALGIVPDQTYYWRVDDIAADGLVITGDVWSFWTPPGSAYNPSIADGAAILDLTANLTWSGGWGPIMHATYFGADADQIANAVGAAPVMDIGFDSGPLEPGTTYYWRVDEFYGTVWVTGPVWSFSTVPVLPLTDDPNLVALWTFDGDSGGVVLDQSGNGNHVALKNGAQVIAGNGGDVLDLGVNGYGAISNLVYDANNSALAEVTVSCWIRTDVETDQYIISLDRDENFRLEINGTGAGDGQVGWDVMTLQDGAQLQIDYGSVTRVDDGEWHHVAGMFDNGTATIYIDGFAEPSVTGGPVYGTGATDTRYGLIGANSEATSFDGSNSGGPPLAGEMDDLAIYNKAFTEDEMRQLYGNLAIAWQPQPAMGASDNVWSLTSLSWTAGDGAVEHDVYLGTDADAVAAADATDASGIYRGRQAETTYALEVLSLDAAYFWRVDEVAADGTASAGRVWPFSTAADIVIFEEPTPLDYDNTVDPFVSEISLDLDPAQNWADPIGRIAISYTGNAAPGSVAVDEAAGTTTITGRGADIWGTADEFQYAYTMLTGNGSMTVKVDSLAHTNDWTKAGIMIRETLDAGSSFAMVAATGANGVRFQARAMADQSATSDTSVATDEQKGLNAPVWIKIERTFPMVSAYYSTDGVTFTPMSWNPQVLPMTPAPIFIGLAVTSHSGADTYADAVFAEISSDGGVTPGPLTSVEIGLTGNAADPMYLVLEDASGAAAAILNPDSAATQQTSATDFIVELADFGIDLTAVTKASLVIGDL